MSNALGGLNVHPRKGVLVDIQGVVTSDLEDTITKSGGEVIYSSRAHNVIHARVPMRQLEKLAEREDVSNVRPAAVAKVNGIGAGGGPGANPQMGRAHVWTPVTDVSCI